MRDKFKRSYDVTEGWTQQNATEQRMKENRVRDFD